MFGLINKNIKYPVLAIVVITCLISNFVSCGKKSDLVVRYEMEKKLNEAERLKSKLLFKEKDFSEKDFTTLIDAYTAIIDMTSIPQNIDDIGTASKDLRESWALALLSKTRIGELYMRKKDYGKAFEYFHLVAKSPASNPVQSNNAIKLMAFCRENDKNYLDAAVLYDSLARGYIAIASPENPNLDALDAPIKSAEMHLLSGDTDSYNKKLGQARDYYDRIRNKFPDTPLYYAAIGKSVTTYLKESKFQQAIRLIQSSRDKSTGKLRPELLLLIADIQMTYTKNFRNAEDTYREFIKHYPDHQEIGAVQLSLAYSLFEQKKYKKTRTALKNIENIKDVKTATVAEAYFLIAICYEKEDRWEQAIGKFDLIQATFPGTDKAFEAALYTANYYKRKNQPELAKNKFKAAVEYINKYTNPETSNPVMVSRALGYLVRCYIEIEDFNKAIETLISAYEKYPALPEGKYAPLKIADLYEDKLNDNQNALKWLKIFAQANPDYNNIDNILNHIKALEQL